MSTSMSAPMTAPVLDAEDARAVAASGLVCAGLLLDDDALSARLGRAVTVTHLRVKTGHSALAAWRQTGDQTEATHGWAVVSADEDKRGKMLRAAERIGEQLIDQPLDGGYLLAGSVWSDRALVRELSSARRHVGAGAVEPGSSWEVLRYNPRRRLVAVVRPGMVVRYGMVASEPGEQVLRVCAEPVTRQVEAARRWAAHGVPVLPLTALGTRGTAAISPRWGGHDLESRPERHAAEAAGAAIAALHGVPVSGDASSLSSEAASTEAASTDEAALTPLPVELDAAAAAVVVGIMPELADRVQRLAEALRPRLDASLEASAPVELHGDLSPDQILHRGDAAGEVRIIDLDRCGLGPRARDLGSWAAACAALDGAAGTMLAEAFRTGYRRAAEAPSAGTTALSAALPEPQELAAWEAYAHLTSAADPFRRRSPQWAEAVARRIARAESALFGSALTGPALTGPALSGAETTTQPAPALSLPPATLTVEGTTWQVRRAWPGSRGRLGVELSAVTDATNSG